MGRVRRLDVLPVAVSSAGAVVGWLQLAPSSTTLPWRFAGGSDLLELSGVPLRPAALGWLELAPDSAGERSGISASVGSGTGCWVQGSRARATSVGVWN